MKRSPSRHQSVTFRSTTCVRHRTTSLTSGATQGICHATTPALSTLQSATRPCPVRSTTPYYFGIPVHQCLWKTLIFAGLAWLLAFHCAPEAAASATNSAASFNVEAATRAYLDQLTPAQKTRSDSYFEGGYWIQLWSYLWGACVALLLLQTRLSARMRDLGVRLVRFKPLQTAIYAILYILVTSALTFPVAVYADFIREHQ